MFERFTAEARMTVSGAYEEARSLGHDFIGTEHLVIAGSEFAGLDAEELRAEVGANRDAEALATLGIDLDEVRDRVESAFGEGALSGRRQCGGRLPFTKRSKKAMELALREAIRAGDREIGTRHVLLGVLREGDGLGARLLAAHGVTVDRLR
jgi:ATP-dependent Clp protease ATP-binding subunit ClpA